MLSYHIHRFRYNSVNGWDITNNVIEACRVGVYAADATSILIEGSVIESVGVPIMLMVLRI